MRRFSLLSTLLFLVAGPLLMAQTPTTATTSNAVGVQPYVT